RDAARHDLAPLGHVAPEQAGGFVVDLRRIIAGERAGLAAGVGRGPGGGGGGVGHRGGPFIFAHCLWVRVAGGGGARSSGARGAAIAARTAPVAAAEAAALAAAEAAAALATEPTTTALAIAALVAVALAHLDRRLGLVRLDPHGEEADHIGRERHAALHLGH